MLWFVWLIILGCQPTIFLAEKIFQVNTHGVTEAQKLCYNATSRLIELEGEALKTGKDLRHTIISNLDDPDNPNNQRIALMGVSFDDLTLADWEAAKLGQIESPFTFNDYQMLDT